MLSVATRFIRPLAGRRPMLLRSELEAHTLAHVPLLPGYQLPVLQRVTSASGRANFWEQRYWTSALRVNQKDFIKRERRTAVLASIRAQFALDDWEICRPHEPNDATASPIVLSSSGLLAWLHHRYAMSSGHGLQHKADQWLTMIQSFFAVAGTGIQTLVENDVELPTISVGSIQVDFTAAGQVRVGSLCTVWPSLPLEWNSLRGGWPGAPLSAWLSECSLHMFFRFVNLRCLASSDMEQGHWMMALRTCLLRTAAWLLDIAVQMDLDDACQQRTANPSMLHGPRGLRLSKGQQAYKVVIMQALHGHGSGETITRTLHMHHGGAAAIRSVFCALYERNVQAVFSNVQSIGIHWDGSTHNGLDVQLGVALCTSGGVQQAAYLRPVVPNG